MRKEQEFTDDESSPVSVLLIDPILQMVDTQRTQARGNVHKQKESMQHKPIQTNRVRRRDSCTMSSIMNRT